MAQMRKVQVMIEAETDRENSEIENTSVFGGLFLRAGVFQVTSVKVLMHEPTRTSGMVPAGEEGKE